METMSAQQQERKGEKRPFILSCMLAPFCSKSFAISK
jgi:hypothetical protein